MKKAGPLFILVLLSLAVAWPYALSRSEEARAADLSASDQAVVPIGRQATVVPEYRGPQYGMSDAASVTRDAQKELQRVGCYDGEISGVWTPASRQAAHQFLDRINARLPVDKPDEVLLALLRSSKDGVCGSCPRGQEADAAGRCTPAALLRRPTARVVTGSLSSAADRGAARASDKSSSVSRSVEPEGPAAGGQRQPGFFSSWGNFMRKVDRALGLN